ncbi:hypothetical protein [Bradyrhizobium sp. sBnM-33]|uniref:hypothetical protein n=1 Tax=Bradyrhizobium sp. sBnM-33 TaxID=2831780 RepID=UPI0020C132A1|nr:hypothetical protein [Bradyrhizobium sp. sBnM-33]WOH52366.1 hypothetical protein RX328_09275 [Bradyrhizobium sp. sBnM-33]
MHYLTSDGLVRFSKACPSKVAQVICKREAAMDPHNFDSFNVRGWPQVEPPVSHEPEASDVGQGAFEQQLHQARPAGAAMPDRGPPGGLRTNVSSDGQQSPNGLMGAIARSNILPREEVLINDERDTAGLRAAKRPRTANNPQGVAIERQLSEIANSGEGGGAMPPASALQPAQSTGVLIRHDRRPLYSDDAPAIFGLGEALIKDGSAKVTAERYVSSLLGFSRWLFAKKKPSIVARLDSNSLNGSDVHEYIGKGDPRLLIRALDHLRTLRSGAAPIIRRAKLNLHALNVALINPEEAVVMERRRVGATAAQYSGSQEADTRREELQGRRDNQSAPSAFVQEHVAFYPQQIAPEELRRVLDHLNDQSIPSPVSVPSAELERLERDLHDELRGRQDDHAAQSLSVDPEEFTFNPEQFSPGELQRMLDDRSIPSPVPAGPEYFALNLEQFSPKELWRLLNADEPAPLGLASSSGPADQSACEPGPLPNLSMYLPLDFQHGPHWASEDFMQGMRLHNLLPSASQPETKFSLNGVNYAATLGPAGHEDQVFLRAT